VTLGFKFKPLLRTEGVFIDVILKSLYNLQGTETGSLWRAGVFALFVSYRHSSRPVMLDILKIFYRHFLNFSK